MPARYERTTRALTTQTQAIFAEWKRIYGPNVFMVEGAAHLHDRVLLWHPSYMQAPEAQLYLELVRTMPTVYKTKPAPTDDAIAERIRRRA